MKFVSRLTMAAAIALAVPAGLAAPAMAQALSPNVGKPLQEASSLAKSGNLSAAMARVNAARSAADTGVERRKVAEMAAYVYTRGGKWSAAARELEAIGAPATQLAPLYYRSGDFAKAIALGKKAGGVQGQTIVAQSYFRQGRFSDAANVYEDLIRRYGAREGWLQNLANVQYKSGDKKAYLATTERLIRVDPSPARWRALLIDLKKETMPREAKLTLYQLMRETKNITTPEDYQEFSKLAIVGNQPGLSKVALEEGVKSGVLSTSDSMTARLLEASTKRASAARADFAKLPKTADGYMQGGSALMGVGNYAKAAVYFSNAIKAGTPDIDQAHMLLGISQLRSGKLSEARKAFGAVAEDSPYSSVAALWSLYASTRSA